MLQELEKKLVQPIIVKENSEIIQKTEETKKENEPTEEEILAEFAKKEEEKK
jgi:hypothetical protein